MYCIFTKEKRSNGSSGRLKAICFLVDKVGFYIYSALKYSNLSIYRFLTLLMLISSWIHWCDLTIDFSVPFIFSSKLYSYVNCFFLWVFNIYERAVVNYTLFIYFDLVFFWRSSFFIFSAVPFFIYFYSYFAYIFIRLLTVL